MNKKIFTAVVITFVVAFALKKLVVPDSYTQDWKTTQIKQDLKPYTSFIEVTGQVQPKKEYFVTLNSGGQLDSLYIKEGQQVEKDQILGIVNENINKAKLESSLSSFKLAEKDFYRMKKLYNTRSISRQQYDQSYNQYLLAKSSLKQAKQNLENSVLRSPSKGTITHIAFKQGDTVPNGSRVAIMEDLSEFKVLFRIHKGDIKELSFNTPIHVNAFPYNIYEMKTDYSKTEKIEVILSNLSANQRYSPTFIDIAATIKTLPKFIKVGDSISLSLPNQLFKYTTKISKNTLLSKKGDLFILTSTDNNNSVVLTPANVVKETDKDVIVSLKNQNMRIMSYSGNNAEQKIISYYKQLPTESKILPQ